MGGFIKRIASESEITTIIQQDAWMMDVLRAVESLNLPDWWIGAGFLRNKIWDYMEGRESLPSRDVDLVYFDRSNVDDTVDWVYDERVAKEFPFAEWEIRNQARMHYVNNFPPFSSTDSLFLRGRYAGALPRASERKEVARKMAGLEGA